MPPRPTDSGLIALYEFNNNILDTGPSGYHLVQSGLPLAGFENSIPIPPYGSFALSGLSSAAQLRALFQNTTLTGVFNKTSTPNWTIEFQIFPTGVGTDSIIFQETSGLIPFNDAPSSYWMVMYQASSPAQVKISQQISGATTQYDNININKNQWSHIAYAFNSSGNILSRYHNNILSGISTGTFFRPNMTKDIVIAGRKLATSPFLATPSTFLLKNFAIYNYEKTNFDNFNNTIRVSGIPDSSYRASIYDKSFNLMSSDNLNTYNGNSLIYTLPLTGVINRGNDFDLLVFKNNWICARNSNASGMVTGYSYNFI